MKIGFVVLAHDNVFRLRQVVRFLANGGAPIALHLDKKASPAIKEMLVYNFSDLENVIFVEPLACEWGDWSLVEATIRSTKLLMERFPELDYIQNISGTCLPVKSVVEMEKYLSVQGEHIDHIECFGTNSHKWVKGGLAHERTSLYHPFNWRTSRRAFDLNVKIQRLLKVNRRPPNNIEITYGSQWWCLSTRTLTTIYNNSRFDEFVEFFKKSWIPDESFFQTIVGHFSKHISSKSLTYANFDHEGKPFIFYDDHLETISKLDRFFVRKVWQGADDLYDHFLNPFRRSHAKDKSSEGILTSALDEAKFRATQSRKGLISQFRYPEKAGSLETSQPYQLHIGMETFRESLQASYDNSDDRKLLGHIFKRNQIQENPNSEKSIDPNMPLWRDYSPSQFLMQKIWYAQPQKIAFFANAHQIRNITHRLANDHNCDVYMVRGAWLLHLAKRNITNPRRIKSLSQIELKREELFISTMRGKLAKANLTVMPIGQILDTDQYLEIKGVGKVSLSLSEDLVQKTRLLGEKLRQQGLDIEKLGVNLEPNPLNMPNVIDLKTYKKSS